MTTPPLTRRQVLARAALLGAASIASGHDSAAAQPPPDIEAGAPPPMEGQTSPSIDAAAPVDHADGGAVAPEPPAFVMPELSHITVSVIDVGGDVAPLSAFEASLTPIHETVFADIERVIGERMPKIGGFAGSIGNTYNRYWVRNRIRQRLAIGADARDLPLLVDQEYATRPKTWTGGPHFPSYRNLPPPLLGSFVTKRDEGRYWTYEFGGNFERWEDGYLRWRAIPFAP